MEKYSTIILDLFDTIVDFNFNHLPTIELKGFRSRTTSTEVYEVFKQYYPHINFEEFYQPFIDSYHEFQEMKLEEFREFPNRNRFKLMLSKMHLDPTENQDELEDKMVVAHMNALARCVEFPEENKRTLKYIKNKDQSFEKDILPKLINDKSFNFGYLKLKRWYPIDNKFDLDNYKKVN